jgi:4-carboxymuconolactone decarboxylase
MSRLNELGRDQLSAAQRRVYDDIVAGPRGSVRGPFVPLVRSAGLADHVQKLGAYIRYESKIPGKLREFAILIVARHWGAKYEWAAHVPLALKEGLAQATVDALNDRRAPAPSDPAEAAIHRFCTTMLSQHRADDRLYREVLELLGEEQLVDLVGLIGYYTLIAMTLNTFEVVIPAGAPVLKD